MCVDATNVSPNARACRITDNAALDKKKKPAKAPATCADNKDKRDCTKLGSQEGDCAWCVGEYMPASCMSAMAAKYLPETVAKCKPPKGKVRRGFYKCLWWLWGGQYAYIHTMYVCECCC
jgi:hypothetical protein